MDCSCERGQSVTFEKVMSGHTYIVLGQEMERTEELVVFEVKGAGSLEVSTERLLHGRLLRLLLETQSSHLLLVLAVRRARGTGRAPRPARVMRM